VKFRSVALCASIAMLSACGGGGGTPTPTATGTPAPTPVPTPSPTPPPTTFNELTGDQVFNTACVSDTTIPGQINFSRFSEGFTFNFQEAGEIWSVQGQSANLDTFDISFGPDDISAEEEGLFVVYRKESPLSTSTPAREDIFGFGAPQAENSAGDTQIGEFVRLANFIGIPQRNNPSGPAGVSDLRNCVFGIATELDDTLPSTTITFSSLLSNNGTASVRLGNDPLRFFDLDDSILTFTADPATGDLSFTLELQGQEVTPDPNGGPPIVSDTVTPLGSFSGNASISGDVQGFEGTTANSTGLAAGEFTGWFFGPQGAELGLAVNGNAQLQDSSIVNFRMTIGGPQDP
jgi:hypothetical protein